MVLARAPLLTKGGKGHKTEHYTVRKTLHSLLAIMLLIRYCEERTAGSPASVGVGVVASSACSAAEGAGPSSAGADAVTRTLDACLAVSRVAACRALTAATRHQVLPSFAGCIASLRVSASMEHRLPKHYYSAGRMGTPLRLGHLTKDALQYPQAS